MSVIREDVRYTQSHEWVRKDGDRYVMGVTDYAQHQLGDIVMIELPRPGAQASRGKPLGVIEAVKTASDFYAPFDGTVDAVNEDLEANPDLVNGDPYGAGWIVALKANDEADYENLLTPDQYRAIAEE